MSTNTLETAYANGEVIDASHINELTLAILGELVGRNASGVPTPNQSLGTLAIPWGNLYATGIILNGLALDTSQITSLPNRIVSGRTRALSSMPDFLRANGSALSFDILGASTDLILSINNTAVSISSDITTSGITAAPSTNNTADINDTTIINDIFVGEDESDITIDAVGPEITSRVGEIVAFKTPTGEIFRGLLKSPTKISNVYRGYYFNGTGLPIDRDNLSNNDTITLMNIGWVFVEDNGATVDISYKTPVIAFNAPSSPSTGDYWFDISNQVWKRYSGTTFEIINRILIGEIVSDETNTIASRSLDFSNNFEEKNNIDVDIFSAEIVRTKEISSVCSVYGTTLKNNLTKLSWNITTDLESGITESSDTLYYLYLSDKSEQIISNKKPYYRADLKGQYHPHHSWRCVGFSYNDSGSNLVNSVGSLKESTWNEGGTINIDAVTTAPTKGTTQTDKFWYKKRGSELLMRFEYRQTSSGSSGSGAYLISILRGFLVDKNKITLYPQGNGSTGAVYAENNVGNAVISGTSSNSNSAGIAYMYNENKFGITQTYNGADGSFGSGFNNLVESNLSIAVTISVPIKGWF